MASPRVLILTSSYPTPAEPVGGIFVNDQARALASHADVRIVHFDRGGGGRQLRPVRGEGDLPLWRIPYPYGPRPVSLAALAAAARPAWRCATQDGFRPDVVHAHFFLAGIPALAVAWATRLPLVVTEHWSVFLPEDPLPLSRPLRIAAKTVLERADAVLPVSHALDRGLAAHGIAARTRVVPNLVDTALFHPPSPRAPGAPPRLLTVGLLYGAKGIDLLLEACRTLADRGTPFRLDIAGDGELRPELERLHAQLALGEQVAFLGALTKPEIADLMRGADLFVLPSRYDNNPVALIEALASGLPAVATDVGGVADVVGDDGLLVAPDADAIAAALADGIDGLDRFDRAAIARRAAARFSADAVVSELLEVYADVRSERASHRHASR